MRTTCGLAVASVVILSFIALPSLGRAEAVRARHAGVVVAVDKAAGTIVVGDMGPMLPGGESKIAQYTMAVTPSTEFVRVKRAAGAAPSGWLNDYVETALPAWDVKPGDWVAAIAEKDNQRLKATKIMVVDTIEP